MSISKRATFAATSWRPGVATTRLVCIGILAIALYGCESPSVALKLQPESRDHHRTATQCTVQVRSVVDARTEPQGLGNTLYTRIEAEDVTGWITDALNRAGFLTGANVRREGDDLVDVFVKAVYVRPVCTSRVASVVLGVEAPGSGSMKHYRGTDTSVHTGASAAAITRILNAALDEAIRSMRRDYGNGCA